MKKIYLSAAVFFIYSFCNAQSPVNLIADKDNTIYSSFITNSNGVGQYFFVGKNSGSNDNSIQRALIHFDVSTIPAGATITGATLSLTISKTAPAATGITLHKVISNWGEGSSDASGNEASGAPAANGDATWTNRIFPATSWTTNGGDFESTISADVASIASGIGGATPVLISGPQMINDIKSWISTPASNYGWIIKSNNEGTSASIKRIFSANHTNSANKPVLSITYTPGTVPINLLQFSATNKNGQVLLFWETAVEISNKYFDIEHSNDAVSFETIGSVKGNNNSTSKKSYSFYHKPLKTGIHYYRLVQHDFDGSRHHTVVTSIRYNEISILQLYPNPAASVIYLKSNNSLQGSAFSITSADGKTTTKGILNALSINISQLHAGRYELTLTMKNGEMIRSSFIKKP